MTSTDDVLNAAQEQSALAEIPIFDAIARFFALPENEKTALPNRLWRTVRQGVLYF